MTVATLTPFAAAPAPRAAPAAAGYGPPRRRGRPPGSRNLRVRDPAWPVGPRTVSPRPTRSGCRTWYHGGRVGERTLRVAVSLDSAAPSGPGETWVRDPSGAWIGFRFEDD